VGQDFVRIGFNRQRVTLQRMVETADEIGQPVQTWVDVMTFWARVKPLRGNEAVVAKQIRATASDVITLRYPRSVPITPQDRFIQRSGVWQTAGTVLDGGRVFNIVDVPDVFANYRELAIVVEEVK
jgi:SPP1 family predicted phage head-tail adaptor